MVFKIDPQAKIDIQDQIYYYNNRQKGLGKSFLNDVKNGFAIIQKNPFYQIRYKNVRCLPLRVFPAMIHFTIHEHKKLIVIRAILHTSLDPEKWELSQ